MLKKELLKKILLLILTLTLFSCASYKNKPEEELPAWIEKVPAGDADYEYFTASGTNKNFTLAEADAKNNLINEIIRYLGVSIKTETTTTALGSVENLEKILKSEISQSSAANIKKLKIKNRYTKKNKDSLTVYLLAEYDKNELRKERNRLLKIAEEKILSVSEPQKKADEFVASKKYYSAALYYTKAASAALSSGIENGDIKFRQNISNAKESLKKIKLNLQKDNLENTSNDFLIPINIGTFEERVPLLVSYKTKVKNSTTIIIEGIETDQNGTANFILHDEKIEPKARIRIELDISEIKQILGSKDFDEYQEAVKELQQIVFKQIINFEFKKPENKIKKEQKGTVSLFIEQADSKNSIIEEKILDILKDMNFKTISAKNENPAADFFIYARIETDEVSKAADGFLVRLNADIEIKNPNTQEILYKKNISKRGAGFTEKEAHRSASVAIAKVIALVFNGIIDE
ncbi:hypothetical protein E4N80_09200 [Treponema denticola]|uniref:Lipoprotein n=1 Tax=Treponema denticola TaxID=158 RepID=A0A9Q9BH40_TREDN|nr:LPP20 family lipoprotein [Treponema denticola]UTC89832.1 hypothetical protein E4N87_03635 [Treponema denticola]UTD00817.1 hypothetical protein E4N86_08945 [Treponema denticola]UTD05645.1 hypothetical protein E4N80_09200 [Treponema denticola]